MITTPQVCVRGRQRLAKCAKTSARAMRAKEIKDAAAEAVAAHARVEAIEARTIALRREADALAVEAAARVSEANARQKLAEMSAEAADVYALKTWGERYRWLLDQADSMHNLSDELRATIKRYKAMFGSGR